MNGENGQEDPRRIVIFRNRLRPGVGAAYARRAGEIYELAQRMPGFVDSKDFVAEDGERLTVIEFASAAELAVWREHGEHRHAQEEGRQTFLSEYRLQVCRLERESRFAAPAAAAAAAAAAPANEEAAPSAPVDAEGGCACGAIRYRVRGVPSCETWCHCTDCRRASGAPAVAWATFRPADVTWTAGQPRRRRSSERAQRGFCADCGTPLTFEGIATPAEIDLTIATLDAPEAIAPRDHIFTRSQLPWVAMADGLPRFATSDRNGRSI